MSEERFGGGKLPYFNGDANYDMTRDLLPVVCNPNAVISRLSKMKTIGKTPSVYNTNHEAIGFPKWTQYEATEADVARWRQEPDYGLCIQTRHVRALDIDVDDPHKALQHAIWWAEYAVGVGANARLVAVRYRIDSGRLLIPFIHGEPLRKQTLKVDGGVIEILADGQQFVAAGTHPNGERYQWTTLGKLVAMRTLN